MFCYLRAGREGFPGLLGLTAPSKHLQAKKCEMLVSDYYMFFIVLHFALIGHKYLLLFRYLLQIVHNTLIISLKPV